MIYLWDYVASEFYNIDNVTKDTRDDIEDSSLELCESELCNKESVKDINVPLDNSLSNDDTIYYVNSCKSDNGVDINTDNYEDYDAEEELLYFTLILFVILS